MRILFIETFYGGSHKTFADQWISNSRHRHHMITMPARFWKWRQSGAAMYLAARIPTEDEAIFDVMVISGMIDLAHLKALRPELPPAFLYVHENQFAYPMKDGEMRDFRYGITDLMNILCAETVVFNSDFNRATLLEECRNLFSRLPDAVPNWTVTAASGKSRVIYPGIDAESIRKKRGVKIEPEAGTSALIIWNHRHEHDKDPDTVFRVLEGLHQRAVPFSLAILGKRFSTAPAAFNQARNVLADHIIYDGYPPRGEYLSWLIRGDIVVSAALQENFGLSIIEAAIAGCWPLLPRRLAYPEVMPDWVSGACFWNDEKGFDEALEKVLGMSASQRNRLTEPLSRWLQRYSWEYQARKLDDAVEETAGIKS